MSVDTMSEVNTITREQREQSKKEDAAARIIPEGTWEGLLFMWNKVEESEKGEKSGFHGVPQYRIGLKVFDCPEDGETASNFFNFTTVKLKGEKGRPKAAYKSCEDFLDALDMFGQPVEEALDQGKVTRLRYNVGVFEGETGPVNFLRAVTKV